MFENELICQLFLVYFVRLRARGLRRVLSIGFKRNNCLKNLTSVQGCCSSNKTLAFYVVWRSFTCFALSGLHVLAMLFIM